MDSDQDENVNAEELFLQLRNWQQQQQQNLLKQQEEQRKMLLNQQKKILSVLNSPENNIATDKADSFHLTHNNEKQPSTSNQTARFSSPSVSIDDVPLKKPRSIKSFNQLLETSIVNSEEIMPDTGQPKVNKFPFLKRGQGIARFGMKPKPSKTKPTTQRKKNTGKENKAPATGTRKIEQSHVKSSVLPTILPSVMTEPSDKNTLEIPSNIEVLDITGKSQPCDKGNGTRDEEDLAIFELLERFATINASFSSTSSLIGQLLDKGLTHLPSPSKVIDFLTKKRNVQMSPVEEEESSLMVIKSPKGSRRVHFAESLESSDSSFSMSRPWISNMMDDQEPITKLQESPFISNTVTSNDRVQTQDWKIDSPIRQPPQLREALGSPIGFPDLNQLLYGTSLNGQLGTKSSINYEKPQTDIVLEDNAKEKNVGIDTPSLPIDDPQIIYQSSLLRSRLLSLERELTHYRKENDALRKARKEHEDSKVKLEQEQEKFKRYVDNEKRRMQLLYSEEQKRLRAEQLKELTQSKGYVDELEKLKEELKQVKDESRLKESKWMASQTKFQERIRLLELRNRELTHEVEKLRSEEQNLRKRLNASLRPGAMMKAAKNASPVLEHKPDPIIQKDSPADPFVPESQEQTVPDKPITKGHTEVTPLRTETPEMAPTTETLPIPTHKPSEDHHGTGGISHTVLPNGIKIIFYPNGNRKEIWPDGKGSQVIYYNGDVKQKLADGSIVYTYADSKTKHTTKPDGTDILEFTSGQIETKYPDGRSEIRYPGGAVKLKYVDGREEAQWPDGTKLWSDGKGHGVMTFPSGMREIYTPLCKRREYPDGTVKTVFEDGRSETRYANGRIRIKDKAGKVITDTG